MSRLVQVKGELGEGVIAVLDKARSPFSLAEILRRMEKYGRTMLAGQTPSR